MLLLLDRRRSSGKETMTDFLVKASFNDTGGDHGALASLRQVLGNREGDTGPVVRGDYAAYPNHEAQ